MRTIPSYPLTRVVEELVPAGKPVLTLSAIAEAYTSRETIVPYESSRGEELRDILWTPMRLEMQPLFHKRFNFEPEFTAKILKRKQ